MSRPELGSSRRGFLNWFLGTATGAFFASIFYPVFRYLSPPHVPEATTYQIEAGPTNDPELLDKGFKIVRFGSEPVILIRVAQTDFRAFAATCTHLDCIVEYQPSHQRINCNCHNGHYDLTGLNIAGPPPRPLDPFQVNVVDRGANQPGMIVISKA